jgi:PAS domain S-box-containing protein
MNASNQNYADEKITALQNRICELEAINSELNSKLSDLDNLQNITFKQHLLINEQKSRLSEKDKAQCSYFSELPLPCVIINDKFEIIEINSKYKSQFCTRGDELFLDFIKRCRDENRVLSLISLALQNCIEDIDIKVTVRLKDKAFKHYIMNSQFIGSAEEPRLLITFCDVCELQDDYESAQYKLELFEEFINTTPDLFYIKSDEGVYKFVNKAFEGFCGHSADEVNLKNDFEIFDFEQAKKIRGADKRAREEFKLIRNEEALLDCNGNKKVFVSYRMPLKNLDGAYSGLIATCRDITRRYQLEMEIRAQLTFLETLMDNIPNPIFFKNVDGVYIDCNKAFCELINEAKHEIVGKRLIDIVSRETADAIEQRDYEMLVNRQNQSYEMNFGLEFGVDKSYITNKSIFYDQFNQPAGIIGAMLDISERIMMQEKEKEAKEFLQMIVDCIPIGVYWKDLSLRYLGCNKYQAKLLGEDDVNNIIGKKDSDFYWLGKEVAEFETSEIEVINSGKAKYNSQYSFVDQDFNKIWLVNNKLPLFDEKGRAIGVTGSWHDVSGEKSVEEELVRYTEDLEAARTIQEEHALNLAMVIEELEVAKIEAERANLAKSEFIANISHEIRTPLNAVLGFSEILLNKSADDTSKRYLNAINSSGKALLSLINDILDLSKIEAGRIELNYEALDLVKVIKEIENVFSKNIEDKGLKFSLKHANKLPIFFLDEVRVRQILFNIIGNAIKFTDDGGIEIVIDYLEISKTSNKANLEIKITDTGIGIPEDQCEEIFKDFVQRSGQDSKKYGGTGLGLAITKRLVEKMNGSLRVESEVDKGSSFIIKLPNIEINQNETSRTDIVDNKLNPRFKGQKILIADDVQNNIEVIKGYLDGRNLVLLEADGGEAALRLIYQEKPDMALVDIKMPDIDGYEVAETISHLEEYNQIPIIAITASVIFTNEKDTKKSFAEFISKPFTEIELFNIMCKYLEYDNIEVVESVSNNKANNYEFQNAISLEICERFQSEWEIDLEKDYYYISKFFIISKVVAFSEKILKLGESEKLENLVKYGKDLHDYTLVADISRVKNLLKEFPNIIKPLKQA